MAGIPFAEIWRNTPINARAYVEAILGRTEPFTEKDFSPALMSHLKGAIEKLVLETPGAKTGDIDYGQYNSKIENSEYLGATYGLLYEKDPVEAVKKIIVWSLGDRGFELESFLGRARWERAENGDIIIKDKWDLIGISSDSPLGKIEEFGAKYGRDGIGRYDLPMAQRVDKNGNTKTNSIRVHINLGPLAGSDDRAAVQETLINSRGVPGSNSFYGQDGADAHKGGSGQDTLGGEKRFPGMDASQKAHPRTEIPSDVIINDFFLVNLAERSYQRAPKDQDELYKWVKEVYQVDPDRYGFAMSETAQDRRTWKALDKFVGTPDYPEPK